jgi:hypothetical protein
MLRLASVVVFVALAGTASAQEPRPVPAEVQPGARVRVAAPNIGRVTGRVISAGSDSLALVRDRSADTLRLASHELQSLDLSVGRHKRRWTGAGLGFLGGAAAGTLVGLATYEKPKDCSGTALCDLGPGFDAAFGAFLFGIAGGITGAFIGAGRADDWKPVTLASRTSLQLGPWRARGGAALGLSLRF